MDLINTIIDRIVTAYDPDKVILFGSYAYGTPTTDSDIDICVVKAIDKPRTRIQAELTLLLADLGTPVDIIAVQPDELKVLPSVNHVKYDIMTKGILAYERT
jgi:predicted nucleotidyltransferase